MLTTLESLRQYLGKDGADTQDDDLLFETIKRKSKVVNNFLDRNIEAQTYTEYYRGDGTNCLMVRQYPIISITSIYDDVGRVWPESTKKDPTTIAISNQTPGLIQLTGDIFINSAWWNWYNIENIKITYVAGYSTIPYDIEEAVNKLCSVEYAKSKGMMAGVKSDRDPKSLEDEAFEVLSDYKRIR